MQICTYECIKTDLNINIETTHMSQNQQFCLIYGAKTFFENKIRTLKAFLNEIFEDFQHRRVSLTNQQQKHNVQSGALHTWSIMRNAVIGQICPRDCDKRLINISGGSKGGIREILH